MDEYSSFLSRRGLLAPLAMPIPSVFFIVLPTVSYLRYERYSDSAADGIINALQRYSGSAIINLCPTEIFMIEENRCLNSIALSTRLSINYLDLSHLPVNLNYPSAALHSVFVLCSSYSLISVYAKSSPHVIYM